MTSSQPPLGHEPGKIPAGGPLAANWGSGELKDAFDSLNVDNTYDAARQYEAAVNLWEQGVQTFARSITRSISEAWEGESAEAAKTAIQNYTSDAQNLSPALQDLAQKMGRSAEAVVNTKKAIPETVHIDATSWLWLPHRFDLEERQGQARQQAWEAYKASYVAPLGEIDTSIPVLPHADSPAKPPAVTPGPGIGGDGGPSPGPDGPAGTGGPGPETPGDQPAPETKPEEQPGSGQADTPKPAAAATDPAGSDPNAVQPSSFDPNAATPTTPSSFSGGPSTGGTGGSGGGLGGPGSAPGIAGPGLPGTSAPGTGQPGAGRNPAAAAAGSGAGRAGMAGMPGMGAMGRGQGEGDEDREHKTPDYLINEENAAELIGELPPTLPGGVIGGDRRTDDRPTQE